MPRRKTIKYLVKKKKKLCFNVLNKNIKINYVAKRVHAIATDLDKLLK